MRKIRKEFGFTLVELMIVVAIIAILVAIALPSFRVFYSKAKAAEAIRNIGAIRTLQIAYRGINDTYLVLDINPPGDVPANRTPWGNPGGNWDELGFAPMGPVRYQYSAEIGNTGNISTSFRITAQADFKGDGAPFDTWVLTDKDRKPTHTDHYE